MKTAFFGAALAAALVAPAFAADTYKIDATHSEVSFQVRHIVSKVRGTFSDFEGTIVMDKEKPAASSVEFKIATKSINTNNEKRDNHLRTADFFDAEKYPHITFKSTKVEPAGTDKYNVTGTLDMHGVSKEVVLPVGFTGSAKAAWGTMGGFETSTTLNRKDFNIIWNKALDGGGVVLGDEVMVTINIEAGLQEPEAASAKK